MSTNATTDVNLAALAPTLEANLKLTKKFGGPVHIAIYRAARSRRICSSVWFRADGSVDARPEDTVLDSNEKQTAVRVNLTAVKAGYRVDDVIGIAGAPDRMTVVSGPRAAELLAAVFAAAKGTR